MQIQGTGEIGSTKRKFQLSGVPLIVSRLYKYDFFVSLSFKKQRFKDANKFGNLI